MKIRKVIRKGLPETNSSSSHSVTINMTNNFQNPKIWNLQPDENGIIHVPGNVSFGWEWEKFNDVLTKLQYVCGIICHNEYEHRTKRSKKLFELKKIILDFTGAKDVIFDWETEYNDKLKNGEDPEEIWLNCPEIDHNSHDIFPEIVENKDTLKNFIFNPESWLYLGNDNSCADKDFYCNKKEEIDTIASIDFSGEVGRVDFNIPNFPCNVFDYIREEEDEISILENIKINPDTREAEKNPKFSRGFISWKIENPLNKYDETDKYLRISMVSKIEMGSEYIYYISNKFKNQWINEILKQEDTDKNYSKYYIEHVDEKSTKTFYKTLSKTIEGVDWIKYKITITSKEFGIL